MVVLYSHHPHSFTGFLHMLLNTLNWPHDRLTYFCSFGNCKRSHSDPFILLFSSLFITTFKDTFQLSCKTLTNKGNFGSDFLDFWTFRWCCNFEGMSTFLVPTSNIFLLQPFLHSELGVVILLFLTFIGIQCSDSLGTGWDGERNKESKPY